MASGTARGGCLTHTKSSTRGVAVQAAVAYGLWCARDHRDEESSLSATPELRELLEEKLDLDRECARAVRAVFGQYLPYLRYLDRDWTEDRLSIIFTRDDELESYRAAAWGAFVRFARLDRDLITLLQPEFRHAIGKLPPEATERLGDEHTRLAEYVAEIFLADLDDAGDSIVDRFFGQASSAHRTHAIRHIGLSLRKRETSPEQRHRIERLWQQRLNELTDGDPELGEYGSWFSSRQFTEGRGLELLVSTLKPRSSVVDKSPAAADDQNRRVSIHQSRCSQVTPWRPPTRTHDR